MKILEYFIRGKNKDLTIYRLKADEWDDFINSLTKDFRLSYITDNKLKELALKSSISSKDFLEKYIIPSKPIIKSGDFGEILSFFSVRENFRNNGIYLVAPRKWRWKDNKDRPSPCADSVLFHIENTRKYSEKDLIVTIESKMKSVNSSEHRIQKAIDDASKDKLSRLSKTLIWLEEKYAKMGSRQHLKIVQRFNDPATHGNFRKIHKAIAIIDRDLESYEIDTKYNNPHGVNIIVFSIKDLQKAYEQTRINIINSGDAI